MLVPSGTQGNLISILAHTWSRGCEYIVGDRAHSYVWEQGGPSQFGGVHARALRNLDDGTIPLDEVAAAIRGDDQHFPVTALFCLEDTHNMCGGRVLPLEYLDAAGALARERGIKLHLDGARLWNAIASSGIDAARRLQPFDSVSVCLSKGLGAPVGSVVAGSAEFMLRARRLRKGLGGGMRQAGVLAAAGIYALENNLEQFAVDHGHAQRLGKAFADLPGLSVDLAAIQSNIIMINVAKASPLNAKSLVEKLALHGVRAIALPDGRMRLVTHLGVDSDGVSATIEAAQRILLA